ncbi:two-component system, OmpR family, sensor histidine kinase KdpD [Caldanaerobius fijiensis DSM 17918]|uniref:Two-component system, OmpR family, sensor histidine kinase KdpD n=1 Tax=Caldanaerobius fijiensis DSM 17918 TaxID=1121256 RepID=A0A1M4VL96_9THEO|nr:KdpD-like non-kinase potassium sensor [Caldanaerobius fijiensis]SHE69811.1 two-component system, OmpR family, sensor histidine kinase KdpD [Caldanaerobius fijiensis DSM 17918]
MENKNSDYFLRELQRANKGRLKIYIGAAPGVGKTYKMLRDANELKRQGIDVVIGFVETYGRKETEEQIGELEILPLKKIYYNGMELEEMDLEGIIARKPQLVVVDELAHRNAPGSKNKKRYKDVLDLIENGISVMTAVNIQHLESLNDYINRMTGIKVGQTVPDYILEYADEIEVVDISPEALRERIRQGKVYSSDKIEMALNNFFREGNLTALRELALREVANEVDERLLEYRNMKKVEGLMGAQERILVCINLRYNSEYLIRRSWRVAKMLKAKLYVLHVSREIELRDSEKLKKLDAIKQLCDELDAEFKMIISSDPVQAIIDYAKEQAITQIVLGQSARRRIDEIIKGSIVRRIMQKTRFIDILIVADPYFW